MSRIRLGRQRMKSPSVLASRPFSSGGRIHRERPARTTSYPSALGQKPYWRWIPYCNRENEVLETQLSLFSIYGRLPKLAVARRLYRYPQFDRVVGSVHQILFCPEIPFRCLD